MVSFPPVFPPRPYTLHSPHPYAPDTQPISFFSNLSSAQYWVRNTDHLALRYAISSIPPLPRPSWVQIFSSASCSQTPLASFPPAMLATKFHTIQNNRQNYSYIYIILIFKFLDCKLENKTFACNIWWAEVQILVSSYLCPFTCFVIQV